MSPKLDSSGIVMPSASQPLTTWTVIQPAQLASFEFHMSLETLWSKKNMPCQPSSSTIEVNIPSGNQTWQWKIPCK